MEKIKVRYNGNTDSSSNYTSPTSLTIGQIYEIQTIGAFPGGYTACTLRGIDGTFNPLWFDKIEENITSKESEPISEQTPKPASDITTFVAISQEIPETGKSIILKRGNGKNSFATIRTTTLKSVEQIEKNIYICQTKSRKYIVQVF